AGRLVATPFRGAGIEYLENLQVGGSMEYASIDRNNVDIHVKTAGLTPFFDVSSSTKFNIIREADSRAGYGAELGWSLGPLALSGEYIRTRHRDVATSAREFDIDLQNYYISLFWMATGETPMFQNGVLQPVAPNRAPRRGGWGALGLAIRWDVFETDEAVYDYLIKAGNSVREARAYSFALNWILNPHVKVIFDASTTRFDIPLLIDRDPRTGEAVYSDREDVFTGRFQFMF
ncbi:MAG: hypothetical protein GY859_38410, partial [Desulfobacterales bacterium]|nr:hypothetical protein [Desulfobacterales bacterium]